jgi:hypothetical protein
MYYIIKFDCDIPHATTCSDGTANWTALRNIKRTLSMDCMGWDSKLRNKCGEIKLN